jgi:hypothetical protein
MVIKNGNSINSLKVRKFYMKFYEQLNSNSKYENNWFEIYWWILDYSGNILL